MTRSQALAVAAGGVALTLIAAAAPSGLTQAQPGLWEINGVPGAAYPLRQCLANMAVLARFEHRARNCSVSPVREGANLSEIDYNCGAAGFGHSDVTVITPRSLRVATQGISDGLPFNYVLQARRVADCQAPTRH